MLKNCIIANYLWFFRYCKKKIFILNVCFKNELQKIKIKVVVIDFWNTCIVFNIFNLLILNSKTCFLGNFILQYLCCEYLILTQNTAIKVFYLNQPIAPKNIQDNSFFFWRCIFERYISIFAIYKTSKCFFNFKKNI